MPPSRQKKAVRSASTEAAKAPYPLAPSSFPNCDRFTGSQFGHLEFYNAARDFDDGGHFSAYGYGKTKTSGRTAWTFAPLFAMLWLEYMN